MLRNNRAEFGRIVARLVAVFPKLKLEEMVCKDSNAEPRVVGDIFPLVALMCSSIMSQILSTKLPCLAVLSYSHKSARKSYLTIWSSGIFPMSSQRELSILRHGHQACP